MAQDSSSPSVQQQVESLMSRGADVALKLADGTVETHASILAITSDFFRDYMYPGEDSRFTMCETNDRGLKVIPLPDIQLADWMKIAPYLYPIHPTPTVQWDIVEPLLLISHKYSMQYVQKTACSFFKQHASELSVDPSSPANVWKWLMFVECLPGFEDLVGACCDRIGALYAGAAITDAVAHWFTQVNHSTLQRLLKLCRFDHPPSTLYGGLPFGALKY